VTKAVAEHAGLRSSGAEAIRGIGDEGPQHGYEAYADNIKIGNLEFKDCTVTVLEKGMGDTDGLIGADVFSNFLVSIDYPLHKIKLDPLPSPPNQVEIEVPSLSTANTDNAESHANAGGSVSDSTSVSPRFTNRYIAPEMKDWVQIYHVGHNLIIPVSLRPPEIELFIVDTGGFSTIVSPEAAREVTKVDVNTNMTISGLNGAVSKPYVAESLDIRFGGISKHELGVPALPMEMESMYSAMNISGLLGADILEELTIHIDYRDGLMKFEYDPKRGYHPQNH
jgi:predicted aspartyl protease